ncbi:MAG TPA: cytochrome P450 [Pyrinomonadaceae bacterium]|jgi:cytochrome P450/glutathione S-transferase
MVSIPVSPYCEMARWLLDRLAIPYDEERHAPVFHVRATRRYGSSDGTVPVLDTSDAALLDARQVFDYYEARCPEQRRLYPADTGLQAETRQLFDLFFDQLGVAVRAWAYAYMLPFNRAAGVRVWTTGVPWWERLAVPLFYPVLVKAVRRSLELKPDTIEQQRAVMESVFEQVEARLADGRRYLVGERFTAADLALAALAAPALLPPQYGGPMPAMDELPQAMRADVEQMRARAAGQFILRLYREERPRPAIDPVTAGTHKPGDTFKDKLFIWLTSPRLLRAVFKILRRRAPILLIGKRAIVTLHDDVIEVLSRDTDFTIAEVNEERINAIDGPFILGMDRSERYDRESAVLRQAVRRDDLERIRNFVRQSAEGLTRAAQPQGRIDVIGGLARVVPVRLVESYFGIPAPDEPTMMRWMRDVFHDIFANPGGDPLVHRDALNTVAELRAHMDAVIARRKSQQGEPGQPDDVLGRLLALQDEAHPWLDNDSVRRNLGGMIAGAVDTTNKFVSLAIDELLRRPEALGEARRAALAFDMDAMRVYAYEAVRFNPHHPVQARFCRSETEIARGTKRARRIPSETSVYIATLSAMFDPEKFPEPDEFRVDRNAEYLHFGYGMHRCFGQAINGVQIPELLAALLRLPNLRRASGSAGQLVYDGPFPQRLILEFDSDGQAPGGPNP